MYAYFFKSDSHGHVELVSRGYIDTVVLYYTILPGAHYLLQKPNVQGLVLPEVTLNTGMPRWF